MNELIDTLLANPVQFSKEDLRYSYKWDVFTDYTNSKTLNRVYGKEVLDFINNFFAVHNLSSIISFRRAEYLLYNHLPINIKNKKEIMSWLLKHWHTDF